MKKDQGRIVKQCLNNDEPVFALRGQDFCAIPALNAYYHACEIVGCSDDFLLEIKDVIQEFTKHQCSEPTKKPD